MSTRWEKERVGRGARNGRRDRHVISEGTRKEEGEEKEEDLEEACTGRDGGRIVQFAAVIRFEREKTISARGEGGGRRWGTHRVF